MDRLDVAHADDPPNRDWTGRWIWTGGESSPDNAYCYFRREVTLEDVSGATLYVTADTRYKLYVNGERWGERFSERGYTSTLEEWSENGSRRSGEFEGFPRSHSHAWSAHPAEFLIRNLTGFDIEAPGCEAVSVDAPADITVHAPGGIDT